MSHHLPLDAGLKMRAEFVDQFVEKYLNEMSLPQGSAVKLLRDSMKYSATNGGKRFRPVLSTLIAELYKNSEVDVLPFATAVEFIHTYSLIHDDLPCMDNDDIRRGKPTNHKVYGEAFALLAGDSLLTEAFWILSHYYGPLAGSLVKLLSEAAGIRGMVGGQAIDLKAGDEKMSLKDLENLHSLKTGAMIRVAVEGAALIANAPAEHLPPLKKYGELLGLAFQVADDILDHGEKDQDSRSFTGILGVDGTREYLKRISAEALAALREVSKEAVLLEYLIQYNQMRRS